VLPFREEPGGVLLHIRLTPKGGRDGFDGLATGADGKTALQARVRAVPEDGAANAALVELLAKTLKVRKSAVELVAGVTARQKTLRITGDAPDILTRLEALCRA
jgi:uncharacterized protein